MSWGIFKVYDWIKNLKTPKWVVDFLQFFLEKILVPTLKNVGEGILAELQRLCIKAYRMDIPNTDKFKYVYSEARVMFSIDILKDRTLNLLIEMVYNQLKEQGIIQ